MARRTYLLLSILAFLLPGCRENIEVYRVPKETPATKPLMPGTGTGGMAMIPGMAEATPEDRKSLSWKTPAGWEEKAPSAMRVASFLIKGENGKTADLSAIPLSGEAGGDLANINRWRAQIQLAPLTESDLDQHREQIRPGGRPMWLVNFASAGSGSEASRQRLMAAVYKQRGRTWFFKMTGDDATVSGARPAFLDFLASLKFHEAH